MGGSVVDPVGAVTPKRTLYKLVETSKEALYPGDVFVEKSGNDYVAKEGMYFQVVKAPKAEVPAAVAPVAATPAA